MPSFRISNSSSETSLPSEPRRAALRWPDARGLPVNLGHDEPITILALAELVRDVLNSKSSIQILPYNEVWGRGFQDLQERIPDLGRARDLVSLPPSRPLAETIRDLAESIRTEDS